MLGRNIRYYRQLRRLSQEALADLVGLNKMAISNYEADKRVPNMETIQGLARALGISLADLLAQHDAELKIEHGAFRKHSAVGKQEQELILGNTDRYLGRLYAVVSILGDAVLPPCPRYDRIPVSSCEEAGRHLRHVLGLSESGPVGNIVAILENMGFLFCPIDLDEPHFSGNSGYVNGRPYIAINTRISAERQRFTLIHELAHLVFIFDNEQNEEKMVDGIAGAFLLPRDDMIRELGPKRKDIRSDLRFIQQEYNVSMSAVIVRARQLDIIGATTYDITQKWFSAQGWRKDEHSGIQPEESHLLEQLTLRAVAEEEIGISKAAELMHKPLREVRRLCYGGA